MTIRQGPIYEVTCFVDDDIVGEFDEWLGQHVREILRLVVITDCQLLDVPGNQAGHTSRVCQYLLETEDALDEFVDGPAADIEAEIATKFGDDVVVSGRMLREDTMLDVADAQSPNCLNCGTRLRGQYCGNCGQRSRSRLISLWELISDAFGDLFELDSRLWQTMRPLVGRPGLLTHDYLQGRRARYMPPFRMYLVLSLVFFLVAFFDPRGDFTLVTENEPETSAAADAEAEDPEAPSPSEAELARQEIFEELTRDGVIVGTGERQNESADDGTFHIQFGNESNVITVDPNQETGDCEVTASDLADIPDWLEWYVTPARVKHICESILVDEGRAFAREIIDNVPAALIVLLPLMAFVLKVLYPLSRRYYVEHLLFVVHYHAFFFLILTLEILFARIAGLLALPETITVLTIVIASFYIPIYLFVALRRVYGQGRFVTFLKYIILLIAYLTGFTVTMLGALAIAAMSI